MKMIVIFLSLSLMTVFVRAEILLESKDWSAEKDVMTVLEKRGCVAQTTKAVDVNGANENWTLQVIKLATEDGDYSPPMILSFPENQPINEYYEGSAQSDKAGTPEFSLTLLQPASGDKTILANRMVNRLEMIRRLQEDNTFTMSYLSKEGPTRQAEFSLKGSSKVINAVIEKCR